MTTEHLKEDGFYIECGGIMLDLLMSPFRAVPEGAGSGVEGLAGLLRLCLGAGGHRAVLRGPFLLLGPGSAAPASSRG